MTLSFFECSMKNQCSFILIMLYSASARGCTSGKDHDNVSS